jgi:tRNA dimethylallyltransferase
LRLALQNWAIELGPFELHKRLAVLDPEASEKVEPQNLRRVIRALEVIFHTGSLFSAQRKKIGTPYRTKILGIIRPRPQLYARIDARIQYMVDSGLVEEVIRLLDSGYPPQLPAFSAIGYSQIIQYVQGEIQLEEAVMLMKRLTRQYVRRQANWFSRENPDIHWFPAGPNITEEMEVVIVNHLNG